ncbi:MAG: C10 family peptidase, partial [Sedimentisphaerales bacterium]|nr:C10 family peptidase [Sedimentisphaerales bacterium]
MKRIISKVIFLLFVILFGINSLEAAPVAGTRAQAVVRGWMKTSTEPMGESLAGEVKNIDSYSDAQGKTLYHIVNLTSGGFVVVPADDQIEPIIAFTSRGYYDPSDSNPLAVLLEKDMSARLDLVGGGTKNKSVGPGLSADTLQLVSQQTAAARDKWSRLESYSDKSDKQIISDTDISDVRVDALIQSHWSQGNVPDPDPEIDDECYNYYTPYHYVCGCVATAMAQVMRYHEYPQVGIGVLPYDISVNSSPQVAYTRGGDGDGGPYAWSLMVFDPELQNPDNSERQAIGALCYDAGVAAHMDYASGGSGTYMYAASAAMDDTFFYSNVINGYPYVGANLNTMMNPGLDAGYPCMLGIHKSGESSGHAVVCDGYGYNGSSLYHHINMGWGSQSGFDAWYNLPVIDDSGGEVLYDVVNTCIYNIFPYKTGEVISGRVFDLNNVALNNVLVRLKVDDMVIQETETIYKGMYAFAGVPSNTKVTIEGFKEGYVFNEKVINVQRSQSGSTMTGNLWGVYLRESDPVSEHDICDNAVELFEGEIVSSDSYNATGTWSSSCGINDRPDVWHKFRPSLSGSYRITVDKFNFDINLSVYDTCDELTWQELACSDDRIYPNGDSRFEKVEVTVYLEAQQYYYIRVAGNYDSTGEYRIRVLKSEDIAFTGELPWYAGTEVENCFELDGGVEADDWQVVPLPANLYDYNDDHYSLFTEIGNPKGWHASNGIWEYALPFTFNFYGQDYDTVYVSTNGFLDLAQGYYAYPINSTNELMGNVIIAPLWDNLETLGDSSYDIYIDESDPCSVAIRWKALLFWPQNPCNFSVTLFHDGTIRFDYGLGNTSLTPTVGISAGNGSDYLTINNYDGQSNLTLANSVLISYNIGNPPLPTGVSLDSDGCLSGTPVDLGTYKAIIQVSDDRYAPPRVHEEQFEFNVESPEKPYITPWLHAEGNRIKDPAGNVVVLRGVNLIDLGFLEAWQGGVINMIDRLTDKTDWQGSSPGWYPRVFRMPISPADIPNVSDDNWPNRWSPDNDDFYNNILRPAVDYCAAKGIYVIIDWHYVDHTTLHVQSTSEFWEYMAPRFANDSNVIFDLFNEPVNRYGDWREYYSEGWDSVKGNMETWIDIVRTYAPNNLILVAGPSYSQAIGSIVDNPIDDPVGGNNIAYVSHIYPGHWLFYWPNKEWYTEQVEICAAEYPVFMSEWGFSATAGYDLLNTGTIDNYGQPLIDWIESMKISSCAWVASLDWEPSMFMDWTWELRYGDDEMGYFLKDYLYAKRNDDQPGGTGDTLPPAAPTGLTAIAGEAEVNLDWDDNTESNLIGYHIYRSTTSGGDYTRISDTLLTSSAYTDTSAIFGIIYYYVVTAEDIFSFESGYSNEESVRLGGPAGLVRPPKTLTDPQATDEAKSLMSFLVDHYSQKVLSGQQELQEIAYIYSITGKEPAVGAFDLMDYSPSRIEHGADPTGEVESYINWADTGGGIVSLSWHWNAPTDLIDEPDKEWWRGFYTYATTFDIEAVLADPEGERYQLLIRDLDAIAVELAKFQNAGLPVLWRPLHEASGGWFWWGAKGPGPFI